MIDRRPMSFIYGTVRNPFQCPLKNEVFLLASTQVLRSRAFASEPRLNMQMLKFIEKDNGVVHTLTMPFIPKDKRWSALHRQVNLPKDFVTEQDWQREATTGISICTCLIQAIFDPQIAYKVAFLMHPL